MSEKAIKKLAAEIAAVLFTDGVQRKAARLVLMDENNCDRGGWNEKNVANIIEARLKAATNNAAHR